MTHDHISSTRLDIVTDRTPKVIDTAKVSTSDYAMALKIGIAQLIHEGKIRLEDILAD